MALKRIIIIGSTGSVGRNAIIVARHLKNIQIIGLAANRNYRLLSKQADELNCDNIAIFDEKYSGLLAKIAKNKRVFSGNNGVSEMINSLNADIVLFASSGINSVYPFIEAIRSKVKIAFANKEILVIAGEYISKLIEKYKTQIIPVDSEHSAIFQCLKGHDKNELRRVILTASGGPFRNCNFAKIAKAEAKSALLHPVWSMGKKITIDSATMMNKALEIIEAKWLFNLNLNQIDVVIHPQSIIHSIIEFIDGSMLCQMSKPDMKFPIQYAFTYPARERGIFEPFDFAKFAKFEFFLPDKKKFPSLDFAYTAIKEGGTMPAAMLAANDVAVERFIKGEINIPTIWRTIEKIMSEHKNIKNPDIKEIIDSYNEVRQIASHLLDENAL
ncbi:MAG TPA: 1-deoxy-D-xylulose-5-phosphate reductoisomerase [Victivallales bacterium]|nr:1-deoxy-D-xylulose-5-phosphate reductoisomerase [Victivallales bacterium]HRR05642.1 1-deoxy-D-xylulose-5-phosphate reductoisomerase [Victivallales bacterium]HRR28563.1 1-deoxy-D-xylulose-5-phosphate reductoisomerase [Victivallales bacterium]